MQRLLSLKVYHLARNHWRSSCSQLHYKIKSCSKNLSQTPEKTFKDFIFSLAACFPFSCKSNLDECFSFWQSNYFVQHLIIISIFQKSWTCLPLKITFKSLSWKVGLIYIFAFPNIWYFFKIRIYTTWNFILAILLQRSVWFLRNDSLQQYDCLLLEKQPQKLLF